MSWNNDRRFADESVTSPPPDSAPTTTDRARYSEQRGLSIKDDPSALVEAAADRYWAAAHNAVQAFDHTPVVSAFNAFSNNYSTLRSTALTDAAKYVAIQENNALPEMARKERWATQDLISKASIKVAQDHMHVAAQVLEAELTVMAMPHPDDKREAMAREELKVRLGDAPNLPTLMQIAQGKDRALAGTLIQGIESDSGIGAAHLARITAPGRERQEAASALRAAALAGALNHGDAQAKLAVHHLTHKDGLLSAVKGARDARQAHARMVLQEVTSRPWKP